MTVGDFDCFEHAVGSLRVTIAALDANIDGDLSWATRSLVDAADAAIEAGVNGSPAAVGVDESLAECRAFKHADMSPAACRSMVVVAAYRVRGLLAHVAAAHPGHVAEMRRNLESWNWTVPDTAAALCYRL